MWIERSGKHQDDAPMGYKLGNDSKVHDGHTWSSMAKSLRPLRATAFAYTELTRIGAASRCASTCAGPGSTPGSATNFPAVLSGEVNTLSRRLSLNTGISSRIQLGRTCRGIPTKIGADTCG